MNTNTTQEESTETQATPTYELQEVVRFVQYSFALPAGTKPIFTKGQLIKLIEADKEPGSFKAALVEDPSVQCSIFVEEIEKAPQPEASAPPPRRRAATSKKEAAKPAEAKPAAEKPKTKAAVKTEAKPEAKTKKPQTKTNSKAAEAPKTKTKKKLKTPEPESKALVIPDTKEVAALLEGEDALEAIKVLQSTMEEHYFTYGGVLSHIHRNSLFTKVVDKKGKALYGSGRQGFEDYCIQELGIKYRKAMYYIDIYEAFASAGVDGTQLAQIGWTKAAVLAEVVNEDNVTSLTKYASKHTTDEVKAHIEETVVSREKTSRTKTAKKIRFTFSLFEDQAGTVKAALAEAGKQMDQEDNIPGQFHLIVTEWALTREGVEVSKEDAIAALEARYGIKLGEALPEEAAA